MKKLLIHTIIFIFFAQTLLGQPLIAQSLNKPYYNFKTFGINDGLCSNNTTYICKDSKGFLWIGTDRGLQRYNGSSFLTFRHIKEDNNSIVSDNITFITEDTKRDIWVATINGIAKYNYSNGKFSNYAYAIRNSVKINFGDVFWIFEDSRGRLWAGARTGLYLFDSKNNQFINYPPVNLPVAKGDYFVRVSSIKETAMQEIVFSVVDGFVIIDKNGKQQYMQMPEPTIKPINHIPANQVLVLKDFPDEIWVTANLNGLFKYERSTGKWTNYRSGGILGGDLIIKACIDWSKNEWLLGSANICFFNHRTGTFKEAFDREKIRFTSDIFAEANGNLWLSSNIDGIHFLNISTQLFSSIQTIPGVEYDKNFYYDDTLDAVYGMNIYFTSGIVKQTLSNNEVTFDNIRDFTPLVTVLNSFIADNDTLFLAMEKGLWQYDFKKHRLDSIVFKEGNSSSQQAFFFNFCKSGNKIYFTGKYGVGGGPFVYDKTTRIVKDLCLPYQSNNPGSVNYYPAHSPSPGSPHGQVSTKDLPLLYKKNNEPDIYSFCITVSKHILYTGVNLSDSIYTYNEITNVKKAIPIPADYLKGIPCSILSLCVDKNENLWCGTDDNGIMIFNIQTQKWIRHINQRDGYFPVLTSEIVCDNDAIIWCNTSEGLFSFNPLNFHYKNYTLNDGLKMEGNSGSLVVLPGHHLLFNNINYTPHEYTYGIINTKPADTIVRTIPISITNLKVLGEFFLVDTLLDNVQQITLPHDKNSFSLNYAGISLTDGNMLMYSYMLEGIEKKWHDAGKEQSLSYVNLPPANYVLHIKCSSRDKSIVSQERLLYIRLLPAWYQTILFKVLTIVFSGLFLFAAIRYYLRQQLKKQQALLEKEKALETERNRIAADMHDDVGAGLSRIRYITSAVKEAKNISDADIDKIMNLSDESVEKMNEIIWSLNQGNRTTEELIYHIRSQCAVMVSNANLVFNCELPNNIPPTNTGWNEGRNIYMLTKEAVNNAVKHAQATIISLEFLFKHQQLTITIADNGKGFNVYDARKDGNGLKNYEKRIAALNGAYHIDTGNNGGTRVVFTIPLNAS